MDQIRELIEKIPVPVLMILGLAYLGYDYYDFTTSPSSPLIQKTTQIASAKKEIQVLGEKVKKAQEFFRSLDAKRAEIRGLAQQLDQMKTTLSDKLDISVFIKMLITEAAKVGLRVLSIKPTESKKHEYYVEQSFDVNMRGVFVQLLAFLDRLSSLERIIRVDGMDVKRMGSSLAPYVELAGTLQVKTYKYLGSKADDLAKSGGSAPEGVTPAPGAAAAPVPAPAAPGGKQ